METGRRGRDADIPWKQVLRYCRGVYADLFDGLLAQDAACRAEVDAVRARPSGQHALMMYERHRLQAWDR